jgi:hypothetical protein
VSSRSGTRASHDLEYLVVLLRRVDVILIDRYRLASVPSSWATDRLTTFYPLDLGRAAPRLRVALGSPN